jgi:hypothetical protein
MKGIVRMSGKFRIGIVTLLAIGALTVALSGTALAQEETPVPAPAPFFGHGFARGMGGQVGLEAAADLADEKGIDLQDVQDAVNAALETAKRDAIEQAVEDGDLTREHADWLLEGLDKGYLGGHGFGHFGGRGGFGGRGVFGGFQRSLPSSSATDA